MCECAWFVAVLCGRGGGGGGGGSGVFVFSEPCGFTLQTGMCGWGSLLIMTAPCCLSAGLPHGRRCRGVCRYLGRNTVRHHLLVDCLLQVSLSQISVHYIAYISVCTVKPL